MAREKTDQNSDLDINTDDSLKLSEGGANFLWQLLRSMVDASLAVSIMFSPSTVSNGEGNENPAITELENAWGSMLKAVNNEWPIDVKTTIVPVLCHSEDTPHLAAAIGIVFPLENTESKVKKMKKSQSSILTRADKNKPIKYLRSTSESNVDSSAE